MCGIGGDMLVNGVNGLVVWCFSLYGSYPDMNIAWEWLIYELDKNICEVVQANGGYNDRGQYFIIPSRWNYYVDKMMADVRVTEFSP